MMNIRVVGVLALVALMACLNVTPSLASGPEIPFESYFAKVRGEKQILKFNDFSGRIAARRIKTLLRSGDVLGDRVLLTNGLDVYFPEGYIVSSSVAFEAFQPKAGLAPTRVRSMGDLEANPHYHLTKQFDKHLGPVCSEGDGQKPGTRVRVRRSKSGVISVVQLQPGRFDLISGQKSISYRVISAVARTYLPRKSRIRGLLKACAT
ncbi:MAG: hypothetical protein ACPGOV_14050 [Magnetovibrionaceae bacterium]